MKRLCFVFAMLMYGAAGAISQSVDGTVSISRGDGYLVKLKSPEDDPFYQRRRMFMNKRMLLMRDAVVVEEVYSAKTTALLVEFVGVRERNTFLSRSRKKQYAIIENIKASFLDRENSLIFHTCIQPSSGSNMRSAGQSDYSSGEPPEAKLAKAEDFDLLVWPTGNAVIDLNGKKNVIIKKYTVSPEKGYAFIRRKSTFSPPVRFGFSKKNSDLKDGQLPHPLKTEVYRANQSVLKNKMVTLFNAKVFDITGNSKRFKDPVGIIVSKEESNELFFIEDIDISQRTNDEIIFHEVHISYMLYVWPIGIQKLRTGRQLKKFTVSPQKALEYYRQNP